MVCLAKSTRRHTLYDVFSEETIAAVIMKAKTTNAYPYRYYTSSTGARVLSPATSRLVGWS